MRICPLVVSTMFKQRIVPPDAAQVPPLGLVILIVMAFVKAGMDDTRPVPLKTIVDCADDTVNSAPVDPSLADIF